MTGDIEVCPICGSKDIGIDYMRTGPDGDEMKVPVCNTCGWPDKES